jgi:hypothetical protein
MKKRIITGNILIQVLWYVIAGITTYLITKMWLSGMIQPWKGIVVCLVFIVIVALGSIITNIIKATKDPDVIVASNLKMDVRRYKQYREWYDEHQRLMSVYGIDSNEEQKFFLSFFKQIKNPNEWRRYQDYRYQENRKKWEKITELK